MLNLIYCELLKLKHSKMVSFSILGVMSVPVMMLIEALQIHSEQPERSITLDGIYNNSTLYVMLLANMMIYVAITAFLFSREYAENTWKTLLPIPISRKKLLLGKYSALFLWMFLLTVATWAGILLLSGIYHVGFGMEDYGLHTAIGWLPKFLLMNVLMFLTITPFAFAAQLTKGFVAPTIASAVMVLGSAALCNQKWGALYPWTATFFLMEGRVEKTGYPVALSVAIVFLVSAAGLILSFYYFNKEDLK